MNYADMSDLEAEDWDIPSEAINPHLREARDDLPPEHDGNDVDDTPWDIPPEGIWMKATAYALNSKFALCQTLHMTLVLI